MFYFIYSVPDDFLTNTQATYREGDSFYDSAEEAIEHAPKEEGIVTLILHMVNNELGYEVGSVLQFMDNQFKDVKDTFPVDEVTHLLAALDAGWSREEAAKGYTIFESSYISGASEIQRIDVVNKFSSDSAAALQAEKDGIAIIRDLDISEDYPAFAYYVDTQKNRSIVEAYFKEH